MGALREGARPGTSPYGDAMEVAVLGPLRVLGESGDIVVGAKERIVLALLAARVGQVVGYDDLVDALWPDDPPRTARRTLQAYVARVRASVGHGFRDEGIITTEGRGYRLALDPEQVDAHRFTRLAELGRRALDDGRAQAAADTLRSGLGLWRGPPYAGFEAAAFARGEARRLTELRRAAHEDLLRARIALGEAVASVAAELEALVTDNPLRETGWSLLASAYAACGDQAAALGAIERARATLAEELGVDPGPEIRGLHARLLAQDPTLLRLPAPPAQPALPPGPLTAEGVRVLLDAYAPPDVHPAVLDEAAAAIVALADGSVERARDESVRWVRDLLAGRVARAARRSATAGTQLEAERAALVGDIQRWRELTLDGADGTPACPWRGLSAYAASDAPWFAGRERLTAELVSRLSARRALLLVGASGTGKSSVLHAGLLAALAEDALPGSSDWTQVVLRPGAHPMRALLASLVDAPRVAPQGQQPRRTVLVIDQLEECWTACSDPQERLAFLDAITELVTGADASVTLVLAARADHAGSIATHPGLAALLAGGVILVGPMSRAELRRVVTVPARRAGLVLDEDLVEALVEDTVLEPGALPLLSTALAEAWQTRHGNRLLLADYLATGGVGSAIAAMAERALVALGPQRQAAARALFGRLAGPGRGDAVTRRRVPLSELAGLPDPRVLECLEPLAAARLLTITEDEVEVAHEAVFRSWPRLREWLAEDAARLDLRRRVGRAAAEWDAEGRDPGALWEGARLTGAADLLAEHPAEFTELEAQFLEASSAKAEASTRRALAQAHLTRRQNRRLRRLVAGLAVTLALALVAGTFAVIARNDAHRRRETATANALAALALTQPNLAQRMLTAVEAVRTEDSAQTRGALLSVLESRAAVVTRVGAGSGVVDVDMAPSSRTAYVATSTGDVLAVDLVSGGSRRVWRDPAVVFSAIRVGPGGRYVAIQGSVDGALQTIVLDARHEGQQWRVPFSAFLEAGMVFTESDVLGFATQLGLVRYRVGEPAQHSLIPWPRVEDRQRAPLIRLGARHVMMLRGAAGAPGRVVDLVTGEVDLLIGVAGPAGALSPDGRLLVTQPRFPGPVVVVDWQRPTSPQLVAYDDQLRSAAFFRGDGRLTVALGGARGGVILADVRPDHSLSRARALPGHAGPVVGLVASPGGGTVWSAGADADLIAWDVDGTRGLRETRPMEVAGLGGVASADGSLAAVRAPEGRGRSAAGSPEAVYVVALPSGEVRLGPVSIAGQTCATALTPDGGTLLVAATEPLPGYQGFRYRSQLAVTEVASGEQRAALAIDGAPCGISVTPDGRWAVLNELDGVLVVDLATASVVRSATLPAMFLQDMPASVSPDGRWVALHRGVRVDVRSLPDLAEVASWPFEPGDSVEDFAWVNGGSTLVHAGRAGRLAFHAVPGGDRLASAQAPGSGAIVDLAADRDGARLASLGAAGDVTLWDPVLRRTVGAPLTAPGTTGAIVRQRERQTAGGYSRPVTQELAGWTRFSGEGKDASLEVFYVSGGEEPSAFGGLMVRIPIDTDELIARACAIAGRQPTAEEWAAMHGERPQRPTCPSTPAGPASASAHLGS